MKVNKWAAVAVLMWLGWHYQSRREAAARGVPNLFNAVLGAP